MAGTETACPGQGADFAAPFRGVISTDTAWTAERPAPYLGDGPFVALRCTQAVSVADFSSEASSSLSWSLAAAGIEQPVRPHDLRHAHASWLLAGGADIQTVKERLGHASITTTEKYLHTLQESDDTALDALAAVRTRHRPA